MHIANFLLVVYRELIWTVEQTTLRNTGDLYSFRIVLLESAFLPSFVGPFCDGVGRANVKDTGRDVMQAIGKAEGG